jgi:hypothetical protein
MKIRKFTQLQDELFLEKLETYILKQEKEQQAELKPFTVEEFINRIEKSELDFKNGRFKSQEELEKITVNW